MSRSLKTIRVAGVVLALLGSYPPAGPAALAAGAVQQPKAFLDSYCVSCHSARLKTAGLVLEGADVGAVDQAPELWEKVVRKLRSRAMPPPAARRPAGDEYDAFSNWLEEALDKAAAANPTPGRPSAHRLNRAEYANAVRDLLGVEVDARSLLPADDSGYGFDNVADVLSMSPELLERYVIAAGKIGRLSVGDPTIKSATTTYRVSPQYVQDDRASEDLPFGSRGGLAARHHFPVDGEYLLKVRLQRTYSEIIRGMAEPRELEIRLDRRLITRFKVGGTSGINPSEQLDYLMNADRGLEVRVAAKAGPALLGVSFVREPKVAEGVFLPRPPLASFEYASKADTEPAIESVDVTGPYNSGAGAGTTTNRLVFACRPTSPAEEQPCARTILSALAHRAYRRPVVEDDLRTLLRFYGDGRRTGGFETGIEWAIERLLVAPDFLFRIERAPSSARPGVPYRLSDLELASRLSFFLWSSIPDERLLQLAERGRLSNADVLGEEVRRMLGDPRAAALVANFGGQWLYLRNVRGHAPDPNLYGDFDDNLREAFQRETELFLESQLREDRSALDLLRANYTFVNERLARHYGIPGVYGSHFRRVVFADDRRAGLLGQGSILTVTSYAHRTSPVVRGKWLLENLLGAPPPPPPANVPALREANEGGKASSVRERLEEHRRNPVCASCHARMDPLGFALENFDAIGRWRTADEAGNPIDASGVLPDGTKFSGPSEFRRILLTRGGELAASLAEKLMTYAVGRGLEYYDQPAVRAIVRQAAPSDYRWSALILGVVKSAPFQMSQLVEGR